MTTQFIKTLHRELKTKIKANIYVGKSQIADTITVSITKNGNTFCIYIDNIQGKILRGLTSTELAKDICGKYKYHLLSQYFYNWQILTIIHTLSTKWG